MFPSAGCGLWTSVWNWPQEVHYLLLNLPLSPKRSQGILHTAGLVSFPEAVAR